MENVEVLILLCKSGMIISFLHIFGWYVLRGLIDAEESRKNSGIAAGSSVITFFSWFVCWLFSLFIQWWFI